MNILFVNPPNTTSFHESQQGRYIEENVGNQFFLLPRIPFQVMASLENESGLNRDIVLLDYEWYLSPELSKEDLMNKVIEKNPDVVCTTLIAQASTDTLDYMTTQLKQKLPKTKIIMGGQAVSILGERIFQYCPNVDVACTENSDTLLPQVLQYLDNQKSLEGLEGILVPGKKRAKISEKQQTERIFQPPQMYDRYGGLIKSINQTTKSRQAFTLGMLENFKGCPYTCGFCAAKKPLSNRNNASTIDELGYLYDRGVQKFYFIDLTFGLNKTETSELMTRLKEFKKEHGSFAFRCITRADKIDEPFVSDLLQAGCYEVGIGAETNDERVLTNMNKRVRKGGNNRAVDILGEAGLLFKLFLIEGYRGSGTASSQNTFRFLNSIQEKSHRYFIQPALSRDILPHLEGFKKREKNGILRRGTMHQLDFRHDGRLYGWDTDTSIRAVCFQMLAYPSTEISKSRADIGLQKRAVMDLPFLVSRNFFPKALEVIGIRSGEEQPVRSDIVHYLEGVYTSDEIIERVTRIYPSLEKSFIGDETSKVISQLRSKSLVDSFGFPNQGIVPHRYEIDKQSPPEKPPFLHRDAQFFWNGADQRYLYFPQGNIRKINQSFYENIPEDAFEFLFFAKGALTLEDISHRLFKLYSGRKGYESREESDKRVRGIAETYRKEKVIV